MYLNYFFKLKTEKTPNVKVFLKNNQVFSIKFPKQPLFENIYQNNQFSKNM